MAHTFHRLVLPALVGLLALAWVLPAAAAETAVAPAAPVTVAAEEEHGGSLAVRDGLGMTKPIVWTIVATLTGALILGVFYLLKRRVGGFPENPSWVAPITIMPSSELPDEHTYGDTPAGAHGHH
jgi:hypothetical protein